ncbi:MAG: hypothetical protein K1W21_12960 [Oscillospiraceae bacterium]
MTGGQGSWLTAVEACLSEGGDERYRLSPGAGGLTQEIRLLAGADGETVCL